MCLFNFCFSIIFTSIKLLVQHLEADLEPPLNNMIKVNMNDILKNIGVINFKVIIKFNFRCLGKISLLLVIKVNMLVL